tara:strand:- start:518 stop:892 length:375 start_codon:yes stop_codon:yes gene_type:complete
MGRSPTRTISELKAGRPVVHVGHGNSMTPRLQSGDRVLLAPIGKGEVVEGGDIVLCTVRGSTFTHLVTAVERDRYQISNNHGHVNGWCHRSKVYGRAVRAWSAKGAVRWQAKGASKWMEKLGIE